MNASAADKPQICGYKHLKSITMTNLERATDLYNQVGQGKILEAFEQYYADGVVMEEPRGSREGKDSCRNYEQQFLDSVQEFHGMEVKSIAEDQANNKVHIEVAMDITFKGGHRVNMEQVAVQKWDNGKIVHERFYYNNEG